MFWNNCSLVDVRKCLYGMLMHVWRSACFFSVSVYLHRHNRNESNFSNHPTIWNPPFPGKMINYCIPSIQTPTFEINIQIFCRAQTGFAKRLLVFDSLCRAVARVIKRLLAHYVVRYITLICGSLLALGGSGYICDLHAIPHCTAFHPHTW